MENRYKNKPVKQLLDETNGMIEDGLPPREYVEEAIEGFGYFLDNIKSLPLEDKLMFDEINDNLNQLRELIESPEYKSILG